MPEHDAAPDPIDEAYRRAQVLLDDEDARAARRAQVLNAVRTGHTKVLPAGPPSGSNAAWRRGAWLAAASLAGFGLFWAADVDQTSRRQARPATQTLMLPAPPSRTSGGAAETSPRRFTKAETPTPAPDAGRRVGTPAPAPMRERGPSAFPAELAPVATPPADLAAPPLPLPPVPHPQAESVGPPQPAPPAPAEAPPPPAPRPPPAARSRLAGRAGSLSKPVQELLAAAEAGRVAELETLLARGAPIDAADADGNTALMNSINADQPAVAALLRQRGASLDQKNSDGLSARDMAKAKGDAALDKALGLDR